MYLENIFCALIKYIKDNLVTMTKSGSRLFRTLLVIVTRSDWGPRFLSLLSYQVRIKYDKIGFKGKRFRILVNSRKNEVNIYATENKNPLRVPRQSYALTKEMWRSWAFKRLGGCFLQQIYSRFARDKKRTAFGKDTLVMNGDYPLGIKY